jgi:hypothetical protein
MEIITYLNTNEEARNILQYGIKDENYYIDADDVLHRFNESYMMDINKTGNIFMAHPEEGLPGDFWDNGIAHNETVGINPTFGFTIDEDSNLDVESLKAVLALTDEYMEKLEACASLEEFEEFVTNAKKDINALDIYKKVSVTTSPEDDQPVPLHYLYYSWLDMNGFIIKN